MSETKEGTQRQAEHDATHNVPPPAPQTFPTHEQSNTYHQQRDWTKQQQNGS